MGRARDLANIVKDSGNILVTGKNHNKHMSSDSDEGQLWITHNDNEGSTGTSIGMWGRGDGTGFSGGIHYVADTRGSEGAHSFYQYNGTTWTRNMSITEEGKVVMPNQPAALAYLISGPSSNGYAAGQHGVNYVGNGLQYTTGSDMVLLHTHHNRLGFYSTSNGRFTAPVSGAYQFNFQALPDGLNSAGNFHGVWAINGIGQQGTEVWHDGQAQKKTVASSVVFQLNQNDYVNFRMTYGGMHQRYTQMSGHLIG